MSNHGTIALDWQTEISGPGGDQPEEKKRKLTSNSRLLRMGQGGFSVSVRFIIRDKT